MRRRGERERRQRREAGTGLISRTEIAPPASRRIVSHYSRGVNGRRGSHRGTETRR
ncbi:MAG: hypothetical protein AVDCRST_MAG68-2306 [uncultured Gemmatimonadetes bacterium]|uniref:Uncharacterized protein n=1 Tax=uncultured Gemmatimonadota bacterium TaxID=203437 RepID=A0A6J4L9Q3_9BACT|nr:MAG: hypothetical protein AVDCRST_MAG68-2306 [uncultured Gemmatimonadota bacterium]